MTDPLILKMEEMLGEITTSTPYQFLNSAWSDDANRLRSIAAWLLSFNYPDLACVRATYLDASDVAARAVSAGELDATYGVLIDALATREYLVIRRYIAGCAFDTSPLALLDPLACVAFISLGVEFPDGGSLALTPNLDGLITRKAQTAESVRDKFGEKVTPIQVIKWVWGMDEEQGAVDEGLASFATECASRED